MFRSTVTALIAVVGFAIGSVQVTHAGCFSDPSLDFKGSITPAAVGSPTTTNQPPESGHVFRLRPGQSLSTILDTLQVSAAEAKSVFQALSPHIDLNRLHAGQLIRVCVQAGTGPGNNTVQAISLDKGKRETVTAFRREDGSLDARMVVAPTDKAIVRAGGAIRSSLFAAADGAGVPDAIIIEMIRAFAWDIDFQRDIRAGDRFEILFDQYVDEAGELVETGDVVYARLVLHDKDIPVYRFEAEDGSVEYYGPDGKSVRKNLLRTPVDGARVSSRYGMRRHPILGYNAMHRGVDFAAPSGTPIYAAGDGKVEFVGRRGGYGKYVRLRHGNEYATAYAHLSRYRKGLRAGASVKQGQTIGYVGSTGRSTGPHLHYEVLRHGTQVNPASIKNLPGRNLRGEDLAKFKRHVAHLRRLLEALPTSIAASDSQDSS